MKDVIKFSYKVTDSSGLHAQPVTRIAMVCMQHESNVEVVYGSKVADGSDALALMGLYVKCGEEITFYIEGVDEEETIEELKTILD
jgi:phosphocarrier protein